MDDELTTAAAAAAMGDSVVNELDKLLTGPNDRAFLVCISTDCKHNTKGHCAIFTLLDVPRMKTGQPCKRYE